MKVAHLICRRDETGKRLNFVAEDARAHIWLSGRWDIPESDANALIGGVIYLHQSKDAPSDIGGQVLGYSIVDDEGYARIQRIVFRIKLAHEGRNSKWRGAQHSMAWYSGVLDLED